MDPSGEYFIGIDTGGTYTDGVLLDHRSRKVMAFSKTLTTRDNLTRGIITALKELRIADPARVRLARANKRTDKIKRFADIVLTSLCSAMMH